MGRYITTPEETAREALFGQFELSALLMQSDAQRREANRQLDDLFSHDSWNSPDFSPKEKAQALQALENRFAYEQGRPAKTVEVAPMQDGAYGYWSAGQNKICVSESLVNDGALDYKGVSYTLPDANMQIYDTVAHEGYHAYQSYALEHPEAHPDKEQLGEWAQNEGKYYGTGDKYLIQPQERDAWQYGSEKTQEAFAGIEARNGVEPGHQDYADSLVTNSYDNALCREQAKNPQVLEDMQAEMQAACQQKGIQYDFGGEEMRQEAGEAPNGPAPAASRQWSMDDLLQTGAAQAENTELTEAADLSESAERAKLTDLTESAAQSESAAQTQNAEQANSAERSPSGEARESQNEQAREQSVSW